MMQKEPDCLLHSYSRCEEPLTGLAFDRHDIVIPMINICEWVCKAKGKIRPPESERVCSAQRFLKLKQQMRVSVLRFVSY